jgi:tetratricopeptide (TPR) repeat protein
MAGAARDAAQTSTFDIAGYLGRVNEKVKSADTLAMIQRLQASQSHASLAQIYHQLGESVAEAHYTYQDGLGKRDTAALVRAASLYEATATLSTGEMQGYLASQRVACYQQASSWDTSRVDYRIRLASAYIEQGTQPMQGVSILLGITKQDSTNAEAQLVLGKFGIVSGQYDKAMVRLEKVLYLQPKNDEAYFLLAEAYRAKGDKEKAVALLVKCGQLVKKDRPDLKKRIDQYILTIKSGQ